MKKISLALPAVLGLSLVLTACQNNILMDNPDKKDDQPPICKRLRRQMRYNRHNPNTEASWVANSQTSRLKQLFKENNCKY